MIESLYVDSNAFILPVVGEKSSRQSGALALLKKIERRQVEAYTSVLTWDEVSWVVAKLLGAPDGIDSGRKLLGFPHLHFLEANSVVMQNAQELRERYGTGGLGPRDAIHCASAITKGIRKVASDDARLDLVTELERTRLEEFDDEAGSPARAEVRG